MSSPFYSELEGWYIDDVSVPFVGVEESEIQQGLFSLRVFPNPFQNLLTIKFQIPNTKRQIPTESCEFSSEIPRQSAGSLKIFDISGRVVKSFNLATCQSLLATSVVWDGKDDSGRRLPPGVYFVRLEAEGFKKNEKVILLR